MEAFMLVTSINRSLSSRYIGHRWLGKSPTPDSLVHWESGVSTSLQAASDEKR